MLAAALILAGLFGAPKDTHAPPIAATCPATPEGAFVGGATTCPALELSGVANATGASLDPAFDVSVPPAELVRPTPTAGGFLAGYAADGRRLFVLPIAANGAFHLYVPLATAAQQSLARLEVTTAGARAERVASAPAEATAEIIHSRERKPGAKCHRDRQRIEHLRTNVRRYTRPHRLRRVLRRRSQHDARLYDFRTLLSATAPRLLREKARTGFGNRLTARALRTIGRIVRHDGQIE